MEAPYSNFNYGYSAGGYDSPNRQMGDGSSNRNHNPGMKMRGGMEYNKGSSRDMDCGRGKTDDYAMYEDRASGYGRDGQRQEYNRYSEPYDDASNRDRDRERERERRRRRPSKPREHDRSRERRDRDRDRGRDRSPPTSRYDDSYSLDGSDDSSSYRDRDRDRDRDLRDDRGGEKWMTDTPTNTILLRGLPSQIDEKDIRAELMVFGAPVKDVRLMRRSTGASRGFAFVEFQSVTDSQRWMDTKQGLLLVLNQYRVTMHYSTPRVGPEKFVQHKTDWTCSKCGVHNFKRRDYCFKCNMSREESDKTKDGDGFDQVGTNPCNTLIFRGLDALTTEESLDVALRLQTTMQSKQARIIRDPATNTSRGYAFCEMNSIADSRTVIDYLARNNVPLEVDGKQVLVSYAKNTFSTVMATLNTQSWDYSSQSSVSSQPGSEYYYATTGATTTATAGSTAGEYDSTYYNAATGQYYDGQGYDYSQYYSQQAASSQTDITNAAAAVAQAAIAQAKAAKGYTRQNSGSKSEVAPAEQSSTTSITIDGKEYPIYPPPDVSTYQFDKSSGYYYDPTTGLYYDANSQYYYNPQSTQFMYWDAEKSTYLPAPTQGEGGQDFPDGNKKEGGRDKKEKVKIAKKIAKDMEKWAKSLNAQKDMMKDGGKKITINAIGGRQERESATADAGFAILEKFKGEDKKLMPPPPMLGGGKAAIPPPGSKPGLVASYGGDSDEEEEDPSGNAGPLDESKLVDWSKLACLLCKRQFQSKEILTKHTQFSDLHKQNLQNVQSNQPASADRKETYRDRAKERREKYGAPQPPEPRNRFQPPPSLKVEMAQQLRAGLGGDNIGNKLMQKMGWSSGMGLGKNAQGIVDPIQAKRRVQNTGLGLSGSNVVSDAGDTYKDAVKKTFFARYSDQD